MNLIETNNWKQSIIDTDNMHNKNCKADCSLYCIYF